MNDGSVNFIGHTLDELDRLAADVFEGYLNHSFGKAAQIRHHVVARRIGKQLGSQREMHADLALRGQVSNQGGVLGGHGSGRNSGGNAHLTRSVLDAGGLGRRGIPYAG